jgi:uncharacterized membrane protein
MTAQSSLERFLLGRFLIGRPRLVLSILVVVVTYLAEPTSWHAATRDLIAWNTGTLLYIVSTLVSMSRATSTSIRWHAQATDEGRFVILLLVSFAAIAAVCAIFAQLAATKDLSGLPKGLHLSLAGLTILTAWFFIHLTFAQHYAHEYFDETKSCDGEKAQLKGGVNFPETDEPDYWDFIYFSFIIGVAAQTADVSITSKAIRRTSLAHSILSFFFNSAILALTINIASGLV